MLTGQSLAISLAFPVCRHRRKGREKIDHIESSSTVPVALVVARLPDMMGYQKYPAYLTWAALKREGRDLSSVSELLAYEGSHCHYSRHIEVQPHAR